MLAFSPPKKRIRLDHVLSNLSPARLYEDALRYEPYSLLTASGALAARSGDKTGRSPADKRIVAGPTTLADVWWGDVNIRLEDHAFELNRERAIDFLNSKPRLYAVDGFAGWDPKYRLKIRVICARPYHALFMRNMLIRPTPEELADFGEPDYVILNAGECAADPSVPGVTSTTSIALSFQHRELVILGTEYAGEMKKGVFTIMNYLMPRRGVLSMHCSATEGPDGSTSLLFGLSGTGKTTLSADPKRRLLGDDEHCWSDAGIFNIEGGCYAKVINLSAEAEPQIYRALGFGAVLENVVCDDPSREVDFANVSLTANTRGCYPIEHAPGAKIPCVGAHPSQVVFLTADAFGVLPPVSRLTYEQAMYHFVSGYTAKVAGTEVGVTDPEATFSACFGGPFLVWHPFKYAELLAERLRHHAPSVWLVNTGWTGGCFGVGRRFDLRHTRAIMDAIHSGQLERIATEPHAIFNVGVPERCPGVPTELLQPKHTWQDPAAYDRAARDLAERFDANLKSFGEGERLTAGGPNL